MRLQQRVRSVLRYVTVRLCVALLDLAVLLQLHLAIAGAFLLGEEFLCFESRNAAGACELMLAWF